MTINPGKVAMANSTSLTISNPVDSKTLLTLAHLAVNTAHQTRVRPATANKTLRIPLTRRIPTMVPTPAKASRINILLNIISHIQVNQVDTTLIAPHHQYLLTRANKAVHPVVIHRRLTVILDMATKDKEDKDMGSKVSREGMGSRAHHTEVLGLLLRRDGGPDFAIQMAF